MLELIMGIVFMCTTGQLECMMVQGEEQTLIQVCNKSLGEHQGLSHWFVDGEYQLVIRSVNCEDT